MRIHHLIDFGAIVKARRIAQGLAQSDLARQIGATQEWVSRLENGRLPNPGLASIMAACRALDLHIDIDPETGRAAMHRDAPELDFSASELATDDPPFLRARM